jgi:hypothetical protein
MIDLTLNVLDGINGKETIADVAVDLLGKSAITPSPL